MKKIDLSELDQFGNTASKTSWNTSGISSNKIEINFGDYLYVFNSNGLLLNTHVLSTVDDIPAPVIIAPEPLSIEITEDESLEISEAEQQAFLDGVHEGSLRNHYGKSSDFSPSDLLYYKNLRK